MLTNQLKLCKKCGVEKPLTDFHCDNRRRDGFSNTCLICHKDSERQRKNKANKKYYKRYGSGKYAAKRAAWHDRNPHKKYEYHKKGYETIEGRARHLFNGAKQRRFNEFTLTLDHVINELTKRYCPVTGYAFDLRVNTNGKRSRSWSPFAPSIDKIDPRKGYTNNNTRIVIWQYNAMKGELSDSEVLTLCRHIVARADR